MINLRFINKKIFYIVQCNSGSGLELAPSTLACLKRRLKGAFLQVRPYTPRSCITAEWHDKGLFLLKGLRRKSGSPSPAMMKYSQTGDKTTVNQSINSIQLDALWNNFHTHYRPLIIAVAQVF